MNDDRKFQERAETMRKLFLARVPADVIAKVAGVSTATVANDRVRVAEYYKIKVPNAVATAHDCAERFRLLLKAYLEVRFETHKWDSPLCKAARILIDFKMIENHFYSLENIWEELQKPLFVSDDPIAKNYQKLIEDCFSVGHQNFSTLFYKAIFDGDIPYEKISCENDLIDLATKFCCKVGRGCLNTLTIDDPKALVESLCSPLTDRSIIILKECYGLEGKEKTLNEIGEKFDLTRERVRQIREKSLRIIRNELNEKKYLISSNAKIHHLEEQYANLDERHKSYCDKTDKEILKLNQDILRLKGVYEKEGEGYNLNDYPLRVQILVQPIKDCNFSIRVVNSLCCYYEYILDIIEDWDNLLKCRNFGKKSLGEIINYLDYCGIERDELKMEDKVLARQIIKRLKFNDS